jgi:hypothetical protein
MADADVYYLHIGISLFPTAVQAENPSVVSLLSHENEGHKVSGLEEVDELASRNTREEGSSIESIEAVGTTLGAAATALDPSTILGPSIPTAEPVVLIVMHGYFILGDVPTPPCAPAPKGKVLGLVAKQGTGFVTETSLSDRSPDLEVLGPVEVVPVPEGIPRESKPHMEETEAEAEQHYSRCIGKRPVVSTNPLTAQPEPKQEAPPRSDSVTASSVLDVTVISGRAHESRLQRTRATILVRKGAKTAVYKGSRLSLHLAPARYQLWAELRPLSSGHNTRCPKRSITLMPAAVMHVTLYCPIG